MDAFWHENDCWQGITASTVKRHKFAGLDGTACRVYIGRHVAIRAALDWEDVTCRACLERRGKA